MIRFRLGIIGKLEAVGVAVSYRNVSFRRIGIVRRQSVFRLLIADRLFESRFQHTNGVPVDIDLRIRGIVAGFMYAFKSRLARTEFRLLIHIRRRHGNAGRLCRDNEGGGIRSLRPPVLNVVKGVLQRKRYVDTVEPTPIALLAFRIFDPVVYPEHGLPGLFIEIRAVINALRRNNDPIRIVILKFAACVYPLADGYGIALSVSVINAGYRRLTDGGSLGKQLVERALKNLIGVFCRRVSCLLRVHVNDHGADQHDVGNFLVIGRRSLLKLVGIIGRQAGNADAQCRLQL